MHRTNSAPCCHEGRAQEGRRSRSCSPKCAPANSCAPPGTCPPGAERTRAPRDFRVHRDFSRLPEAYATSEERDFGGLIRRSPFPGGKFATRRAGSSRHDRRTSASRPRADREPGVPGLRPECAPVTLPQDAPRALNFRGGRGNRPGTTGSVFGQVGEAEAGSRTLRTGSAERNAHAQSGRRSSPPGPVRRPRGCRRRCPPAHWIQYSGPTHAGSMEALPPWPEKSARTGARPHVGGTSQRCVHPQNFRTDHNPAIRNNAP
ncbi:hypothetical protein T45_08655 [Streptomyces turgidiscabies]|nr:hypothetical protein T45_08655 [Streptomyces turgidiscabies]